MCVDWWCSHSDKSYHLRKVAVLTMVNVFRFGFGRYSTVEEVDYTAERCIKHVTRLREMSPLWEMVQVNILNITIITIILSLNYNHNMYLSVFTLLIAHTVNN